MSSTKTSSMAVFGSTGLVGSNILATLLSSTSYSPVHTVTRRPVNAAVTTAALHSIVDADTSKWAATITLMSPLPSVVFSAIGTTRGAAGGVENQWKIDHDLNVELARGAKAAGVKTFVFISSEGVRRTSFLPYSKMKIGVEDTIQELGFDQAIIVCPGFILGKRQESRMGESIFQSMVRGLGGIRQGWQDAFGQDAKVIGRAAVRAVQLAEQGKAPSKFWKLQQADVVKLGRDEWPMDENSLEAADAAE